MNASIEGALKQLNNSWKCFSHKDKPMAKHEVKAVLEYGIQMGYKTIYELTDNEIDEIIERVNKRRNG